MSDDAPAVGVTRLLAEAASKSGVAWIRLPDGTTHPLWFVWHDDGDPRAAGPAFYVVSGPGEQPLPYLPPEVEVILRSKDSGGRLLTLACTVLELTPEDPGWEAAVEVLKPARLNATGDLDVRWRAGAVIHLLAPHGRPTEGPGEYAADSGASVVTPGTGTTAGWRPWHWGGRPQRRRRA